MHPRAMKMQRNCHKCHTSVPSQKSENSKNWINFFSHSQLQCQVRGLLHCQLKEILSQRRIRH